MRTHLFTSGAQDIAGAPFEGIDEPRRASLVGDRDRLDLDQVVVPGQRLAMVVDPPLRSSVPSDRCSRSAV